MNNPRDDSFWDRIIVGIIVIAASAFILAKVLPASKRGAIKAKTETAGGANANAK